MNQNRMEYELSMHTQVWKMFPLYTTSDTWRIIKVYIWDQTTQKLNFRCYLTCCHVQFKWKDVQGLACVKHKVPDVRWLRVVSVIDIHFENLENGEMKYYNDRWWSLIAQVTTDYNENLVTGKVQKYMYRINIYYLLHSVSMWQPTSVPVLCAGTDTVILSGILVMLVVYNLSQFMWLELVQTLLLNQSYLSLQYSASSRTGVDADTVMI